MISGIDTAVYDARTLPSNDNVNPYAFAIDLNGEWFTSKGAMIAYYGNIDFSAVSAYASRAAWVAARFSSPLYAQEWVVASGHGKLVIGDRGNDINSYDLADGNLTIKQTNLLAFETALELKQSIVPGFVTLIGTGKFLASSNGPVIFVEPPFRADPEALLGSADCPSPSHHYDYNWMAQSLMAGVQGDAVFSDSGGSPLSPVAPVGPVGPAGPGSPSCPVAPRGPAGPAGPRAPGEPAGPGAPAGPTGPWMPWIP